ncbi:MAG: hypothetical protein IT378_12845 [Sandaracinaceae bacterium]|nr:hypothetical protein [Sandaracinaceae bacterium]
MRRSLAIFVVLASLSPAPVLAWCDPSGALATLDGVVGAGEYAGASAGAGSGFGGYLGAGASLHVDSGPAGELALALDSGAGNCAPGADDTIVIYVDAVPGIGFADTTGLTDNADGGRAAASAMGTDGARADLAFPAGFEPESAIVVRPDFAGLFRLQSGGSHTFVRALTRAPEPGFATSCVKEMGGITMTDLGSQAGNPIRWIATLMNSSNAFRSNEFHGVSPVPGANIGIASFAIPGPAGVPFASFGPPVGLRGAFAYFDFALFGGTGFTPAPNCAQLSTDNWSAGGFSDAPNTVPFGGTATTGDFARGVFTSGTTGGVYAFDVAASNRALGVLPGGSDFTPGQFTLRLRNDGSTTITSVMVEYDVLVRNDQDRSNSFDFEHSTDGTTFTRIGALQVLSPELADASPAWVATGRMVALTGLAVPPGGLLFLRWVGDDAAGAGSRDKFALDDVVVRPTFSTCGNGTTETGETCDAGVSNGTTPCGCQWTCENGAAGTACGGGGAGPCDAPDTCDGSGACADRVAPAGTVCDTADPSEPCDADDVCDGSTTTCQLRFAPSTTVCNAADPSLPCDADDLCTGSDLTCPARFAPASTVCDAADPSLPCDVDDLCTGTSTSCLARVAAAGTICNAADPSLPCDADDVCGGTSTVCAPAFAPFGTSCRASTGTCDLGASCTGGSSGCPPSTPANAGTPCRDSAGVCDAVETCDGTALGCPGDVFLTSGVCRAGTGACDVAESCDGSGPDCPADASAPDGTPCADSMTCNGSETCMSGMCAMGTAPDCDDGDLCTTDSCMEPAGCANAPIAGCCNLTADCDDGDVCTADSCSGPGGTCTQSAITNCCTADGDCSDGSACTTDTCNLGTNRCEFSPIAGCCTADADCDDGNVCTTNTCEVGTGTCMTTDIPGCCLTAGDCDDGDACTTDACSGSNTCTNDAIAGCCVADADCDDGDVCTTDTCNPATMRCESTGSCADGGTDGGADAGAGEDASVPPADAGDAGFDGGLGDAGPGGVAGGCGCRVSAPRSEPAWLVVIGLAALAVRRRRR